MRKPLLGFGGGLIAGGLLSAYALGVEPYRLQVTHTEITLPRLPAALDGVSILLLADTHISRAGRRERMLADLLDRLPTPDIAVIAGDLIQGKHGSDVACELVEKHVRARDARYAIWGNAEHKPRWRVRESLQKRLTDLGVTVLLNENQPLTLRGETITVAGTDDPYYGHADLKTSLAAAPPVRFLLLLTHSPQIVEPAARAGVDLMLSGHTHGGQVRLPFFGAVKTQVPNGRHLDQGLFDRTRLRRVLGRDPGGDLVLYVSRGIGVARMYRVPLYPRLLCRPEIAWLTLRAPRPRPS